MKKVLFLSPDIIQGSFLNSIRNKKNVVAVSYLKLPYLTNSIKLNIIKSYDLFSFLSKKFGFQIAGTRFYSKLNSFLFNQDFDRLVVLDYYRIHFWQALSFVKKNKDVDLVLQSETKMFPSFFLTKYVLFMYTFFLKKNLKYISKILVYTKESQSFLKQKLNYGKIYLITPPVDCSNFKPSSNKVFFKNDTLKILIVARFVNFKRYFNLLDALSIIKKETNIKFELSILGEGPLDKKILKYIKYKNLGDYVNFLKKVSHDKIKNYYFENDVLVLPSFNEAIGMVVPEAMACGIPTITSDTVGANTYVKKDSTGFIFKTGDSYSLAEKIVNISNKKILEKMGSESAKHIKRNFNVKKCINNFERYIFN